MTNDGSCEHRPDESVALDVWLDFLARTNGDDDRAFEELCSRRSDIAAQLRRLRSQWHDDRARAPATGALRQRLQTLASPLPRALRFRREGEIARGGMGVIHKVEP